MIRVALLEGDADVEPFLHPRERQILGPRAVEKRRRDFARGRYVAHALIASVLSVDRESIAVIPDADGVPWAERDGVGPVDSSVSISHTMGLAAAAMVPLPVRVGVDVERPIRSASSILEDYFDANERAWCREAGEAGLSERAADVWSLKEAGLKALGTGLRVPASAVRVVMVGDEPDALGWYPVRLALGRGAPAGGLPVKGWLCHVSGISLAVAARGGGVMGESIRVTWPVGN